MHLSFSDFLHLGCRTCLHCRRCMHLPFLRLLHPKSVSVTHSPCCMHLSFSHILYRTLRRHSHQLAVCTFHFRTSYTTVYRPHRARWLYAPFIFNPFTPVEHRVLPQHALYASSILVVKCSFMCCKKRRKVLSE